MSTKRDVQISKALSYLLRHGAVKENLPIDSLGFVELTAILAHNRIKSHKTTVEDVQRIVSENDKQRFALKEENGITYICANQGHSLEVSNDNLQLLTLETMPELVYHGTYKQKLEAIRTRGLSRMGRNHIHFTSNAPWSKLGIRKNCNVLIYINTQRCMDDGLQFFRSENGVILCLGNEDGYLGSEYFQNIEET